jgi:hypothetical protein
MSKGRAVPIDGPFAVRSRGIDVGNRGRMNRLFAELITSSLHCVSPLRYDSIKVRTVSLTNCIVEFHILRFHEIVSQNIFTITIPSPPWI